MNIKEAVLSAVSLLRAGDAHARGMKSVAQGKWGEAAAARFLAEKGWAIRGRNARPVAGDARCELDLIAETPEGTLVFVEVKTHAERSAYASRLAGVDRRKKKNLLRACASWLMKNRWHGAFRFDVVEVYGVCEDGAPDAVDHLENVPLFPPKWRFW
ncbi:MAG: YraN family protein [Kiritimatiellae bacterium]|nr:YraN family protein [Kiritimatiellia bacterium]